jgi:hypothetical protein
MNKTVRPFGIRYLETLKVASGVQAGLSTMHISINPATGQVIDRG